MWKEIKSQYADPVVRQHDVGGELQDWWLVEITQTNARSSTAWGYPTKELAEQALGMARSMLKLGLPRHINYKVMYDPKK